MEPKFKRLADRHRCPKFGHGSGALSGYGYWPLGNLGYAK